MSRLGRLQLVWWMIALGACAKVPIIDIRAGFTLADAAWFAEEQTLFVFYRVTAEQGIGEFSQVEVSWRTDTDEQPFVALGDLMQVHPHLKVDCGVKTLCGSASFHIPNEPREVRLRLKYHREGSVVLDALLGFNVIGRGPAHTHRSLIVYGVFDQTNTSVQWRARHQFPSLRNVEVQELGLRRHFRIETPKIGDLLIPIPMDNPYGYAFGQSCPLLLTELGWPPVETISRAVFDTNKVPNSLSTLAAVCARSIVTDATGTFVGTAFARRNPQVRPAFPKLHSPIKPNTPVRFLLQPCTGMTSKPHQDMQIQRLFLEGEPVICIDDYKDPAFADSLAARFRSRIEGVRADGKDMVLSIGLHHNDTKGEVGLMVEKALHQILPFERDKTSPRVSGAFIYDTFKHSTVDPELRRLALWCPASTDLEDLDKIPDAALRTCAVQPDFPDIRLGPFRFSTLPILATRAQYLTFIAKYTEAQAGRMTELSFLAPERTPISQNVPFGDFGIVTFFNNEVLTAAPADAFSFCVPADDKPAQLAAQAVFFRSPLLAMPLPLQLLPQIHSAAPSANYDLGLFWDFPFLLQAKYQVVIAGEVTAFSYSIPFGISAPNEKNYGTDLWLAADFPLEKVLTQCTRFCDHPTFDEFRVYNVQAPFRTTFAGQCYRPIFPIPADGDFPVDP